MSHPHTRRTAISPDSHVIDLPRPTRLGHGRTPGRWLPILLAVGAALGAWAVMSRPEPSAFGLFLASLAVFLLVGAVFGDLVASGAPRRIIVDPALSAVIIERRDGSRSIYPRSSIEHVEIVATQQTWTTGEGSDRRVHARPVYQLQACKAGQSGFLDLKLSGKVDDAAQLKAPLAAFSAALAAVPAVAERERDVVTDAWSMLQQSSRIRVEGPAPANGWDAQNEPLTVHFLPDTRPVRLVQAVGLFGIGSTVLFTFVVMATTLGAAAPPWFHTATLGVFLTAGTFGLVWGLRDRVKQLRFRIDGVQATHSVHIGKREVAYRRWPLEEVRAIEVITEDAGDRARLTLSTGSVKASSQAGSRVVKAGGTASTRRTGGVRGFLGAVGEILGNRIGPPDLPMDQATQLEVLLNAAIRKAREALPG